MSVKFFLVQKWSENKRESCLKNLSQVQNSYPLNKMKKSSAFILAFVVSFSICGPADDIMAMKNLLLSIFSAYRYVLKKFDKKIISEKMYLAIFNRIFVTFRRLFFIFFNIAVWISIFTFHFLSRFSAFRALSTQHPRHHFRAPEVINKLKYYCLMTPFLKKINVNIFKHYF